MPNNIERIENLSCELSISADDLRELLRLPYCTPTGLPEDSFLTDMIEDYEGNEDENTFPIEDVSWYGEWSATTWEDLFLPRVVPCLKGEADLAVFYADGDCVGWRIRDGKATRCAVTLSLTPFEDG